MLDYSVYQFTVQQKIKYYLIAGVVVSAFNYLFYQSIIMIVLFLPMTYLVVKWKKKQLIQARYTQLNYEFKEAILSISAALNAGYSFENALHEAIKDLSLLLDKDAYMIQELNYMKKQMLLNSTIEEVFLEFANRVNLEDVTNFVDVIIAAKRTGGDLIKIINATSRTINDKVEVAREVHTLITAKKYEANIMCLVPVGIILYMWISSPGYMDSLYHNAFGILVMTVMLVVYIVAFLLICRITNIKV